MSDFYGPVVEFTFPTDIKLPFTISKIPRLIGQEQNTQELKEGGTKNVLNLFFRISHGHETNSDAVNTIIGDIGVRYIIPLVKYLNKQAVVHFKIEIHNTN
jgi:hypothetical protein